MRLSTFTLRGARAAHAYCALVALLLLAAAAAPGARAYQPSMAVFQDTANMSANQWLIIHRWGFHEGGTADMRLFVTGSPPAASGGAEPPADGGEGSSTGGGGNGVSNATSYALVVCSASAFSRLQPSSDVPLVPGQVYPTLCSAVVDTLCQSFPFSPAEGSLLAQLEVKHTIDTDDVFYFVFSTCGLPVSSSADKSSGATVRVIAE